MTKYKRSGVSNKDVQISYLMGGMEAVLELCEKKKISKMSLRRALNGLKEKGNSATDFECWARKNIATSGQRGRKVPSEGDKRSYRAQSINVGTSFLRLPLGSLHCQKGDLLSVSFDREQIVVKKAA